MKLGLIFGASVFVYSVFLLSAETTRKGTVRDPRDGHIYKVLSIAGAQWFAENLAYLPRVGNGIWVYGYERNDVAEARETASYRTFGALYDWQSALQACPKGWHLPTDAEWTRLERALGAPAPEAGKVWSGTNQGARMKVGGDSGFDVLLAGWKGSHGFNFQGEHANFWTSSSIGDKARERLFSVSRVQVGHDVGNKSAAFSVRCTR